MSFSQDAGYLPVPLTTIISAVREQINTQFGTDYDETSFLGTNWYKFIYAVAQRMQENEVKTSEIFTKLQEYIALTNDAIQRPSVSLPGLIEAFEDEDYVAAVKAPLEADAGLVNICVDIADTISGTAARGEFEITDFAKLVSGTDDSVGVGATTFTAQAGTATPGGATFQAATSNEDTAESLALQINSHATAGLLVRARAFGARVVLTAIDRGVAGNSITLAYTDNDANIGATKSGTALTGGTAVDATYAAIKLAVATLIKDFVAAGLVTVGTETETIVLSNGQSFDFSFHLPYRIPVLLRLSLTASENNLLVIPSDEDLRQLVFDRVGDRYRLGWNFEPQRYFNLADALWASECVLEYSLDDGTTWSDEVFDAEFKDIFTFGLDDIDVVIT